MSVVNVENWELLGKETLIYQDTAFRSAKFLKLGKSLSLDFQCNREI